MFKIISWLFLLGLLFSYRQCSAQSEVDPYGIGDTFPDYKFTAHSADSAFEFSIDSFRGKAVIIDLWDVHCIGCLYGIKKLDSLQKLFPEQLRIILVTKSTREEVEELFETKIDRPDLISVTGDTMLYDYFFPHSGDPLGVWIDEEGIIKYITPGYNTTAENLVKFFNHETLSVSYQGKLKNFNVSGPLINEVASRLKYYTVAYSVLTVGMQDLINTFRIEISRDTLHGVPYLLKSINSSRLTLYQLAYNHELYGVDLNMFRLQKNNRIILASTRAKRLEPPLAIEDLDRWRSENSFCYELFLPNVTEFRFYSWMQQDLKRFFQFDVSIRWIRAKCLILKDMKAGSHNALERRNIPRKLKSESKTRDNKINLKRGRLQALIYLTQDLGLPLIDETNLDSNLSIKLPNSMNDLDEINSILVEYGLALSIESRRTKFLVIK